MSMSPNRRHGTEGFFSLPMLFMDLETTGESLAEGGEICEAGLVKIDSRTYEIIGELDLKFQVINPHDRTEDQLSFGGYNGFTFKEWADALPKPEALQRMNEFAVGCSPWAYNMVFEYRWLSDYYLAHSLSWTGDYHWFDLMTMARNALELDFRQGTLTKLSLSTIGSYLGIGEEAKPHRGLIGARYEVEVFKKLHQRLHQQS